MGWPAAREAYLAHHHTKVNYPMLKPYVSPESDSPPSGRHAFPVGWVTYVGVHFGVVMMSYLLLWPPHEWPIDLTPSVYFFAEETFALCSLPTLIVSIIAVTRACKGQQPHMFLACFDASLFLFHILVLFQGVK